MRGVLRVEIVVLAAPAAVMLVRRRDFQNLHPGLLRETKQTGAIAAGELDANALDLARRIPSSRAFADIPVGSWRSMMFPRLVAFVDNGCDMQILVSVHAAHDAPPCSPFLEVIRGWLLVRPSFDGFAKTECMDRTVT